MRAAAAIGALLALNMVALRARACDEGMETRVVTVGNDPTIVSVPAGAWAYFEEQGRTLAIEAAVDERIDIDLPPRFGRTILHAGDTAIVRVRRAEPGRTPAKVRVTVACGASMPDVHRDWWYAVAALAHATAKALTGDQADAVAKRAAVLADTAFDLPERALALHLAAQCALQAQRYVISASGFEHAATAWMEAGDEARASAARVGQAESFVANGRYDAALSLAPMNADLSSKSYYSVRLQNSRCLALHYLHRLGEAGTCYGWLERALQQLDEPVERANALRNRAEILLASDDLDGAEAAAREAQALATGPSAPMVRGRAQLTRANVAIARGDVTAAITATAAALSDFTEAGAPAWQGDAKLKAARIFAELGAGDDAYLAVGDALRDYTGDEPALVAAGLTVYADIEREHARYEEARFASTSAEQIYSKLKMPMELERARLSSGRTALAADNLDEAEASRSRIPVSSSNAAAQMLFEAELDMRQGHLTSAARRLAASRRTALGFTATIDAARIEADIRRRSGDIEGADSIVRRALDGIMATARGSGNVLLRRMLMREAAPLRRAGIASVLERVDGPTSGVVAEAAWQWIAPRLDRGSYPKDVKSSHGAVFDRAIAQELLGSISGSMEISSSVSTARNLARRELLAMLATRQVKDAGYEESMPLALLEAERQLSVGDLAIGFLDGGSRAAILVVTPNLATIYPVLNVQTTKATIVRLVALASSSATSSIEIRNAVQELSEGLFGSIPISDPPIRLFVLSDGALDGVPWSLLQWPGRSEPLVVTTRISILRYDGLERTAEGAAPRAVLVFAPPTEPSGASLPPLAFAARESAAIRAALTGHISQIFEPIPTPRYFLAALQREDAWVHVATHGIARPERIGYAGIWLEGSGGAAPPAFLGWLEVLSHGVSNHLVVLDACELGAGRENVGGTLGFASALSEAGARDVVASLWPMSDAASATWVPAFYTALAADPSHNAASALRAAQLRLRESRMFRHPFYWSGLETFSRGSFSIR